MPHVKDRQVVGVVEATLTGRARQGLNRPRAEMRRTQRGEPAGVRQHHRELVLVVVGFVGAIEAVLHHPPPCGGLCSGRCVKLRVGSRHSKRK
jgi:hypothetical protein